MLDVLPACCDLALDAAVEVALFLRREVERLLDDDGSCRKLLERATHLLHRAVKTSLSHEVQPINRIIEARLLEADQAEEVVHVLDGIHDGRRRDGPKRLPLHVSDRLEEDGVGVADAVSLVENDAVPVLVEEARVDLLVVGDVQPIRLELRPARQLPPAVLDKHDVEVRLGGGGNPLTEHSLRTKQERLLLGRVLHEAKHLHRLAQPHLIAKEAAGLGLGLAVEHPLDARNLVRLVLEPRPQGDHCVFIGGTDLSRRAGLQFFKPRRGQGQGPQKKFLSFIFVWGCGVYRCLLCL